MSRDQQLVCAARVEALAESAALGPSGLAAAESEMFRVADAAGLSWRQIRAAMVRGFERAVALCLALDDIGEEEERRLKSFCEFFDLSQDELDARGAFTRLGMAAALREVRRGRAPACVRLRGDLPFLLHPGEILVWVFAAARHLAAGGSDRGQAALSDRALYFTGARSSFRLELTELAGLRQFEDGIEFTRAGGAGEALATGNGWFLYAAVRQLCEPPPRNPPRPIGFNIADRREA